MDNSLELTVGAVCAVLICILGFGIYAIVQQSRALQVYLQAHHCVETHRESQPAILISTYNAATNGIDMNWMPQADKVTYSCDNGIFVN